MVTKRNPKRIGTHSGQFHADESLACFFLLQLAEYQDAEIIRTRDPKVLADCDIIVDVGGVYDPSSLRFDHHQREFADVFSKGEFNTRLSSAGLIYKHFGKDVIKAVVESLAKSSKTSISITEGRVESLYWKLYKDFVEGFDAVDNGVEMYPRSLPDGTKLVAAYKDSTTISSRVARLNPYWNEKTVDVQERFMEAVRICGQEFIERIRFLVCAWYPARELVLKGFNGRRDVHDSLKIMVLETSCPWKEHLFQIEEDSGLKEDQKPLYVVFPDDAASWRVQAVPVEPNSFECRKALPEPWRGIRDEKLDALLGIGEGAVFVHASGFIGGHKTQEGAMKMAMMALEHGNVN